MLGGRAGMMCMVCKLSKLTGVKSGWAAELQASICDRKSVESICEFSGRLLQESAPYDVVERFAMSFVLENLSIRKHGQAVLTPAGV